MLEVKTKQDLYNYLNNFDFDVKRDTKLSSVYFLIQYENYVEPIYFTQFQDVWLESPCDLHRFSLKDTEVMEYVNEMYEEEYWKESYEYELILQRDGWHYDIDCPQCTPFLPDKIKIMDVFSEKECLDWILEHAEW